MKDRVDGTRMMLVDGERWRKGVFVGWMTTRKSMNEWMNGWMDGYVYACMRV
jgi:hypothetical protein